MVSVCMCCDTNNCKYLTNCNIFVLYTCKDSCTDIGFGYAGGLDITQVIIISSKDSSTGKIDNKLINLYFVLTFTLYIVLYTFVVFNQINQIIY